jgi:hypothetical protein
MLLCSPRSHPARPAPTSLHRKVWPSSSGGSNTTPGRVGTTAACRHVAAEAGHAERVARWAPEVDCFGARAPDGKRRAVRKPRVDSSRSSRSCADCTIDEQSDQSATSTQRRGRGAPRRMVPSRTNCRRDERIARRANNNSRRPHCRFDRLQMASALLSTTHARGLNSVS